MADDRSVQPAEEIATAGEAGSAGNRGSSLAPFRHRIFRDVWFASLASNFGGLIQAVGASWMMASISNSADMVALVQASTTLPIMLFSLAAGALSDNFDRRIVMLVAQGFMLVVSLVLTAATWFGVVTPWWLLTFTFLVGCGQALNGPAWQSSVGDMVPREHLPAAVAFNSMGFNIARSAGPALGGLIVAAAGTAAAFAVNAASYVWLMVVLARWNPERPARTLPRETLGIAMSAGIRYVAMSPNIRVVLARSGVFGFAAIAVLALMPLMARDLVHGDALTYGLLLGAFGVGAVGGALLSGRLRNRLSVEGIVLLGFAGFAVCGAVSALSPSLILTMAVLLIGGACWVIALSTFNVTVQLAAPRWVSGRALAIYQMAVFGGMALGSWIWGVTAERLGVSEALLLSALASLAGAAMGLRTPLPPLSILNLDPLRRWQEPKVAVDVEPRSGPIVIRIEYIIDEADLPAFLEAMIDRRRIRMRDGARHWSLLRDLADPRLWIERYDSPTWVEYVRQNQRITQADAAVGERIRALHRGSELPRVQRMIERQPFAVPGHAHPRSHEMSDPTTHHH